MMEMSGIIWTNLDALSKTTLSRVRIFI